MHPGNERLCYIVTSSLPMARHICKIIAEYDMTYPYEVLTTYPLEQILTLLTGNDRKCVTPKKEPTVSCQPCNGDEMEWII